jgi:hypothetical protein
MSARFASSCSRNGMRAAAGDTSWIGDTSMKSTRVLSTVGYSPRERTVSDGSRISPVFLSNAVLDGAMNEWSSTSAARNFGVLRSTTPFCTRKYGVSRKPNSFTLA